MTLKRVFAVLSAVLILALSIIPTFAIPPSDPNIFYPNEPFYMNINGRYFGEIDTLVDVNYSNTAVTFWKKDFSGLAGVEYDYSAYSNREVNNDNSYFLYFDYVMQSNNLGGTANPRMYVWCANGSIMIDEVGVGNDSSAVGFCLALDVTTKQLKVYVMSGGNIQYNTLTIFDVSNWITYDTALDGSQTVDAYSFRIEVEKSTGFIKLQAITTEWFNTIKSVQCAVGPSVQPSYNRLAFGTYDRVDGDVDGTTYGSVAFRHIRYQDCNATYEMALSQGIDTGFYDGYDRGFSDGYNDGNEFGYRQGYDQGKVDGKLDAESSEISVPEVITSYVNSAVMLFKNIFGFEIFGINVSALIGGLTAVVVLAWIIRKLVK